MRSLIFIIQTVLFASCSCSGDFGINGNGDASIDGDNSGWDPPIDNIGDPGWGDNTDPWCPNISSYRTAFSIWSRPSEVFVNVVDNDGSGGVDAVNHIYSNNGSGWNVFYDENASSPGVFLFTNIRGVSGTRLFSWMSNMYPLATVSADGLQLADFKPSSVFVVNDNYAWACADVGLLSWDGLDWRRVVHEPCTGQLWANENSVFSTGEDGIIKELSDAEWVIHDTGTWVQINLIWGFSETDVWVSSGLGLYHYNGETWNMIDWPSASIGRPNAIIQLWGSDNVLFINTGQQVIKYEDGVFETIGVWPVTESGETTLSIVQMWGNGPTEVFFAAKDSQYTRPSCGDYFLLWWDGSEYHWF